MNCRELEPRLTAYLAGELDEVTARAARGHLRVCPTCRSLAEDHARLRAALEGLGRAERPDPPPAMWDAIQRQLGQAEIADGQASRWARWWQQARPHLLPGSLALGACAAAALIIHGRQLRPGGDAPGAEGVRAAVVSGMGTVDRDVGSAPAADVGPPPVRPARDATAELADEAARIEQVYRTTVAELLPMARAEVASWRPGRARVFTVELARREGATVRAAAGGDRDRAWHQLIAFLETTALGERVAAAR